MQNNKIRVISPKAFAGLSQLRMLFLSHNRISRLLPHTFEDLNRLEWLILDNNRIAWITPATFSGLRSLYFLYMLNNSLAKIPDGSLCTETPKLSWLVITFPAGIWKEIGSGRCVGPSSSSAVSSLC